MKESMTTSLRLTAFYMEVKYIKSQGTWVAYTLNEVGDIIGNINSTVAPNIYADTQKEAVRLARQQTAVYTGGVDAPEELRIFVYNKNGELKETHYTSWFLASQSL